MKKKVFVLSLIVIFALATLTSCGSLQTLKDGYYTAEMAEYSNGWKEYLRIQVKQGAIVSAEFNAKNQSGFIKAWDNSYMKNMMAVQETYPNKYTREYIQQLMEQQTDIQVDIVTGATTSGNNFDKLVPAVLKQAEKGSSETVIVE